MAGSGRPLVAGHTNCYHTYPLQAALRGIAQAGFTRVELSAISNWTEHVSLDDPRGIRRLLVRHNLSPASLSAHSDLTTTEGVQHLTRALAYAAELAIPVVNTAIGGHASTGEDAELFLRNVPAIIESARQTGVIVALETHGELMATGAKSAQLLGRIGSEWIRLNYDTANVEYYGGVPAIDDLPSAIPYLAHLHLKDHVGGKHVWNFPALGDGLVSFRGLFDFLTAAGYAGPMSVEIEFWGEPWPPLQVVDYFVSRSFNYLQSLGVV